jgi:resuscitation-promoting factor RpfA
MVRRVGHVVASGLAVAATALLLAWGTAEPWAAVRDGAAGPDEVVASAAAIAAWAVLGWVVIVLTATGAAAAPGALGRLGRGVADRVTPLAVQRMARIAVGLTVAAGPVTACTAAPGDQLASGPVVAAVPEPGELQAVGRPGQPVPIPEPTSAAPAEATAGTDRPATDRAAPPTWPPAHATGSGDHRDEGPDAGSIEEATRESGPERGSAGPAAAGLLPDQVRESDTGDQVVVQRGDTLWGIAARHLGPSATTALVAAEWPRWYAANQAVIGPDPDLILPGMILHPPATGEP